MRPALRKVLRSFLIVTAGMLVVLLTMAAHYYFKGYYRFQGHLSLFMGNKSTSAKEAGRLAQKADEIAPLLKEGRYNPRLVFLVDMGLPSGRNRFFAYDLTKHSILLSGLVAHGCANKAFSLSPVFSNVDGSNCSSLGRYRVGGAYTGQFGRSYLLYGLDSTNDRALDRHIVLHAYGCVPDRETDPYPICNSRGCPMVSPAFLKNLQPLIDKSERPILMWIFD